MRYAAKIEGGIVVNVIVCPSDQTPEQYLADRGIAGEWVECGSGAVRGRRFAQNGFYAEWEQITGAALGPDGAENGYSVGVELWHDGAVRVSRVPNNVNEPLDDSPSTWSRKDGTFVVPAGWQYQPGEEVTEDGGTTWYRVQQATSFAPSASAAQYVKLDKRGGEPIEMSGGDEWAAGVTYTTGDTVTYQGGTYECLQGHTSQVGWEPPNVPALWTQV